MYLNTVLEIQIHKSMCPIFEQVYENIMKVHYNWNFYTFKWMKE